MSKSDWAKILVFAILVAAWVSSLASDAVSKAMDDAIGLGP